MLFCEEQRPFSALVSFRNGPGSVSHILQPSTNPISCFYPVELKQGSCVSCVHFLNCNHDAATNCHTGSLYSWTTKQGWTVLGEPFFLSTRK